MHRNPGALVAVVAMVLGVGSVRAGTDDAWSSTARYVLEYRVALDGLDVPDGATLQVWLPHPMETPAQHVRSTAVESPWPHILTRDAAGNRVLFIEGEGEPSGPLVMRFEVDRRPSTGIPRTLVADGGPNDPDRFRKAAKLIPLEGAIRTIAEQESEGITNDRDKIRAFYDYVVRTMRYNKDGTGWGRGDAVWACDNKRGNCTDFHSLFIGMARSQGIPARFVIGFPVPGGASGSIGGYHCWSEFWDADVGWVPLDASEATKSGLRDEYFGQLPNDRVEFTVGRDLMLTPAQAGSPLNFFIYPYAEIDGAPVDPDEVKATFRFERR